MRAETDVAKAADRDELQALKNLLFAPEMGRLTQAEERVGALDKKLGASDGFEKAVADVMARALLRASGDQPKDMAQALGPSLVMALSHEARASRDSLIEALRPAAPGLVRSARRSWFQRIDNRIFGPRDQKQLARAPISLRLAQIAAFIAIAALAFYGWRTFVRMQHDHSMASAVVAFMAGHPEAAIAPLALVTDHDAGRVEVRVLAGSAADLKAFGAALEAAAGPHYKVVTRAAFAAMQSLSSPEGPKGSDPKGSDPKGSDP